MPSTAHLRINPRETSPHVYSKSQNNVHCTALIIAKKLPTMQTSVARLYKPACSYNGSFYHTERNKVQPNATTFINPINIMLYEKTSRLHAV